MTHVLQSFHLLVISPAGWLNRHQQAVIDYLIEENRVLKDQLEGQRLKCNSCQSTFISNISRNCALTPFCHFVCAKNEGDWIVNTLMVEGCTAPFRSKRKQAYKNTRGQRVNLTYYPGSETVGSGSVCNRPNKFGPGGIYSARQI